MGIYVLEIRADLKNHESKLGPHFATWKKVVNASCIAVARAMAAEDAKTMGEFDSQRAWLNSAITTCKKITPTSTPGVISTEHSL